MLFMFTAEEEAAPLSDPVWGGGPQAGAPLPAGWVLYGHAHFYAPLSSRGGGNINWKKTNGLKGQSHKIASQRLSFPRAKLVSESMWLKNLSNIWNCFISKWENDLFNELSKF